MLFFFLSIKENFINRKKRYIKEGEKPEVAHEGVKRIHPEQWIVHMLCCEGSYIILLMCYLIFGWNGVCTS